MHVLTSGFSTVLRIDSERFSLLGKPSDVFVPKPVLIIAVILIIVQIDDVVAIFDTQMPSLAIENLI